MAYKDAFDMDVTYGVGEAVDKNGVVDVTHFGAIKQIQQVIDYDKDGLPSASNLTIRSSKIPADSAVVSARVAVLKEPADNTVTVKIGTVDLDGTTHADDDSLVAATAMAQGVLTGAGALVGEVAGTDSYITVATSSTAAADLAGLYAVLIVEYV